MLNITIIKMLNIMIIYKLANYNLYFSKYYNNNCIIFFDMAIVLNAMIFDSFFRADAMQI